MMLYVRRRKQGYSWASGDAAANSYENSVAYISSVGCGLWIQTQTRCDASSSNSGDPQSNTAAQCGAYWALCSDQGRECKYCFLPLPTCYNQDWFQDRTDGRSL